MTLLSRGPHLLRAALTVCLVCLFACSATQPEGPVPIVWDREACAECRMLVGEPKFAAQLQTREGDVLNFDDPGCLLRYLNLRKPQTHAVYFHHHKEDRWLPRAQVGFVPASPTPMGYGLAAVPRTTTGALSFEQAMTQVMQKGAAHAP